MLELAKKDVVLCSQTVTIIYIIHNALLWRIKCILEKVEFS